MSGFLKPSINWLFAFIPISVALECAHVQVLETIKEGKTVYHVKP